MSWLTCHTLNMNATKKVILEDHLKLSDPYHSAASNVYNMYNMIFVIKTSDSDPYSGVEF